MAKRVLALGLDPAFATDDRMPGLTPELVRTFIDAQLERVRASGYEVETCLVDLGEHGVAETRRRLQSQRFDCVLIGAGLRAEPQLLLFEQLVNVVHEHAPNAKICFNSNPADSAEAVQRWL